MFCVGRANIKQKQQRLLMILISHRGPNGFQYLSPAADASYSPGRIIFTWSDKGVSESPPDRLEEEGS
jgi:hypothetical protein